jgi:hypothetical protein
MTLRIVPSADDAAGLRRIAILVTRVQCVAGSASRSRLFAGSCVDISRKLKLVSARHISNLDPRTEVPPVGVLPGWKRAKRYLYSDAQIDALLVAALALSPEDGLRRWTHHTLFGLMAVTGMRLSDRAAVTPHANVGAHSGSDATPGPKRYAVLCNRAARGLTPRYR